MPYRTEKLITRAMLRAEPDALFVFGDNMEHRGMGGQAGEMRGEPNAVGIPTKWKPTMRGDAFFYDRDYGQVHDYIFPIFARLAKHIQRGGMLVWPADGIGTGRAQLVRRAPSIANLIESMRTMLERGGRLS